MINNNSGSLVVIMALFHRDSGSILSCTWFNVHGIYKKQTPTKGSRFDKAITYLLNRRDSLMTYLENPRCSLSNNQSERSIRPVTLGRKNYLFSDTQAGADASMFVYSIIETAKANGIHPGDYIHHLLEQRISKDMSDEELEDLAPWSEKVKNILKNKDQ